VTRSRLIAVFLALVVGIVSCGPDEDDERVRRVPADPNSSAAALRVKLDGLFREHLHLLALQTENILTRQPVPFRGASEAFDQHAIAFAEQFNAYYGTASRDAFLKLWRAYQTAVLGYTARTAAGAPRNDRQKRQLQKAQEALTNAGAQLGFFAGSLTPVLSPRGIALRMEDVIARLRNIIGLQIKKDYVKADAELRAASDLADPLAAAFATGIAADVPTTYSGNPVSTSASYRAIMTATFREHVWILGLLTENMLTGQPTPQQGAQAALDANTSALAVRLGQIYGADFEKALAPLWKRHIDLLLAYTVSAKDQAKRDKAIADLKQYAIDFGSFMEGANERLVGAEMAAFLTAHVENLRAVIDAQAKADFTAADAAIRKAADHMDGLAAPLVAASVAKFPSKFL
jgi:hypothetical protein